jgi:hypothetical protein
VRAPLLDPADPLLRDYLDHDLDDGRVRLSVDAVLAAPPTSGRECPVRSRAPAPGVRPW